MLRLEQWSLAAASYAELTRQDERLVDAWVGLAMARVRLGELDAAQTSLAQADALGRGDPERYAAVERALAKRRAAAAPSNGTDGSRG